MRFTDLEPDMLVAVRDYDGEYERGRVTYVGSPSKTNDRHMVQLETGAHKGKSHNVTSREIKCPWDDYADTWWAQRHDELREEVRIAQLAADKALATVELEQLRAALSTLDIESGLGQVVQRTPQGKMESKMALFLPVDEAMKLLPLVVEHGVNELSA
jgi:hypothetical protein